LAVKLLVERFGRRPIKPNHFECYHRTPTPVLKRRFLHSQLSLAPWNHYSISAPVLKKERGEEHSFLEGKTDLAL
jgi:hypothetical protein